MSCRLCGADLIEKGEITQDRLAKGVERLERFFA
jgi:hypothetical protein